MIHDLKYAARALRGSPGLVAVAVLSLGLGIGVNATLFGVFNAVFLRQVTAWEPAGIWRIWPPGSNKISYANYRDLLASKALPELAGSHGAQLNLRTSGDIERVTGEILTGNFFQVFGIAPAMGRGFVPAEENVAVISNQTWWRRYGSDPKILGRVINLNSQPYTVIGVLSKDYRSVEGFGISPEFYLPISQTTDGDLNQRSRASLDLFCRIPKGMTPVQASAILTTMTTELERSHPEINRGMSKPSRFYSLSGLGAVEGSGAPHEMLIIVGVLFVVVGLVLLIACANVASLLLARGLSRRREIAIRLSLGGSRARIVRTLLAESMVLSFLGCGFALLLNLWITGSLSSFRGPDGMPIELQLNPDYRVLLYTMAIALATTVVCGLAPALQSTRPGLVSALKSEERSIVHRRFTLRNGLVVGQVAISLVLLVTAFLFLRSLTHIAKVDPGFNVDHVLTAKIRFEPGASRERQDQVLKLVVERVRALPGVVSASLASIVPLVGDRIGTQADVEGEPAARRPVNANFVGPRYFETMMIPMIAGREFSASDIGGPRVAIVNESFVKHYLAGKSPVGARTRESRPDNLPNPWSEIVGVARDIKFIRLGEDPTPVLYRPGGYQLHARTVGSPAAMLSTVKQAIAEIDRSATMEVTTMQENMGFAFVPNRIAAAVLGAMGGLGLLLAMIGLYGVMANTVTRRTHEIGIRMALGAQRKAVLRMILGSSLRLVGVGVAAGLTISIALTQPLAEFLASGISPTDPMTFVFAAVFLAFLGVGACYLPARRATKVDPIVSLRYE